MQITLVVGERARQLRAERGRPTQGWHVEAAGGERQLATDEQALLDELTHLCHRLLAEDSPTQLPD